MKNIMIRFVCPLLVVILFLISSIPYLHAAGATDDISYFSSPEQADAADDEAHDVAVAESEKIAAEVTAVAGEVKAAKGEFREAVLGVVAAERNGREEMFATAQERLSIARTNLDKTERKAARVLATITAVKQSTISSMRSQQMEWGEIARELGVSRDTVDPAKSVDAKSSRRSDSGEASGKDGSSSKKIGTVRDLVSGISKTPGAIGGKGDKALGLSRVSSKARNGSKNSRSVRDIAANGGRGNAPTTQESALAAINSAKAKARLAKARAKAAAIKARTKQARQ
ncbi:hypothetical protein [Maridesulfovibrio sp.]|uniref:hypothetical protein n=1 Tax=Maridesulfovibrio sp. TaxID=2795000 RepID=UPI003BA872F3